MLTYLKIKNLALIESAELEFGPGLTILLGETGAGKSIIFDALAFVLGERADKNLIRFGEDTMKVVASFSVSSQAIREILTGLDIECDEGLLLSRSLTQSGKNEIKANGVPIPLFALKEISAQLVDAYGQHDNQVLLRTKNHLSFVDGYRPEAVAELLKQCRQLKKENDSLLKEISELGGDLAERQRTIDLLSYQVAEIDKAKIKKNEDEEIRAKVLQFSSGEKIFTALKDASENLSAEVFSGIKQAVKCLSSVSHFDEQISQLKERLLAVSFELSDASSAVAGLSSLFDFSEAEMETLLNRQDQLNNLKKKYGGSLDAVLDFSKMTEEKLNKLLHAEQKVGELEKQRTLVTSAYEKNSKFLSEERAKLSRELEKELNAEFSDVGLRNAKIKIDIKNKEGIWANGNDEVEFLFSANTGENFKPLSKTISGGELSRFMLAFKNVLAHGDIETLLFDEIDAGISGEIAGKVASKLAKLSKINQILCITHLPQVAAAASQILFVEKFVEGERTYSCAAPISEEEGIVSKIAHLLSGGKISESAISHASAIRREFR